MQWKSFLLFFLFLVIAWSRQRREAVSHYCAGERTSPCISCAYVHINTNYLRGLSRFVSGQSRIVRFLLQPDWFQVVCMSVLHLSSVCTCAYAGTSVHLCQSCGQDIWATPPQNQSNLAQAFPRIHWLDFWGLRLIVTGMVTSQNMWTCECDISDTLKEVLVEILTCTQRLHVGGQKSNIKVPQPHTQKWWKIFSQIVDMTQEQQGCGLKLVWGSDNQAAVFLVSDAVRCSF